MHFTWWRIWFVSILVFEALTGLNVIHVLPNYTVKGLIITAAAVWVAFEVQNYILRTHHNTKLTWWAVLPGLMSLTFDAAGDYLHWYSTYEYYDVALHFFGGFATTCFVWHWVRVIPNSTLRLRRWLTVSSVMAIGSIYEIEEYLEDVLTGSHRLGDGFDTANDMLMNTLGCLVAIVVLTIIFLQQRDRYNTNTHHTTTQEPGQETPVA